MKVDVDSNFDAVLPEFNTMIPSVKAGIKDAVKAASLQAVGRIKMDMPVDTGAARGRWGTPGASGGIWDETDEGLTITQGANLEPYEYIERLNEGSSQQAPAGFIDSAAQSAEETLVNLIDAAIAKLT